MRSPLVLVILLALSGSFSFFLSGYGLSRKRVSGALEFAGFMAASALYAAGYAVELTQGELSGMLAVLMPDTGLEGADRAAERFRLALSSEPVAWKGEPIAVTTSVGYCAVVPEEGERLADYLGRADLALYRAKDSGRNRSVAWTPA